MPAANVIQLRQLLMEKFPGLRTRLDDLPGPFPHWPTGLSQIDEPLRGGIPCGALSEIVSERNGCGSALLVRWMLTRAANKNQFAALIDGADSLDVTQVPGETLSRLLWVRCHSAEEALKAADLLLRDGNLPVVLLDLAANPIAQLRRIPATTWYRFQRILEQTTAIFIVLTARATVAPAQARITLRSRFSLDALERDEEELVKQLELEAAETRQFGDLPETRQFSA